jgi:hypothetical protein
MEIYNFIKPVEIPTHRHSFLQLHLLLKALTICNLDTVLAMLISEPNMNVQTYHW